VRQRDALPLPKGHTLKWLGVSDQGVRLFNKFKANFFSHGRVTGACYIRFRWAFACSHEVPDSASWLLGSCSGYTAIGTPRRKRRIILARWCERQLVHVCYTQGLYTHFSCFFFPTLTEHLGKGRQEYPGFPTPLMQELPLQLPFRRDDSKAEEM